MTAMIKPARGVSQVCAFAAVLAGLWTTAVAQAPVTVPPVAVAVTGPPATTIPSDGNARAHPSWFQGCVREVAAAQGKPVDIIFIGDSITQNWLGMPTPKWDEVGGTVWPKWYGNRNVLNFGVGADKTQDVLWRLDTMDIKQFRPKVAVVLIGTNNNKDTPIAIAAGVKAVVTKTQQTFPGVKVILMSILPNRRANATMMAANSLIQPIADNKSVFYFDLAALMTPVGSNWKGVGKDHLHLTADGYELWASAMEPLLDRLLGVKPAAADAPLAPTAGVPLKIACVGDSITAGTGASVRANNYPNLLGRMLGPGFTVQNFGVSGTTLLKMATALTGYANNTPTVPHSRPMPSLLCSALMIPSRKTGCIRTSLLPTTRLCWTTMPRCQAIPGCLPACLRRCKRQRMVLPKHP